MGNLSTLLLATRTVAFFVSECGKSHCVFMVHVMFQTTVLCTSNVELSVVLTISPLLEESNPLQYEAGVEVMFGSHLLTLILYKY
jgi:hypothetical protein